MKQWLEIHSDRLALVLIFIALLRIAATFTVFSETPDEAVHLTSGLELIARGKFSILRANPPLPKIVLAGPLHISGVRFVTGVEDWTQIQRLFHSNDHYRTNLFLGRIGNLLFFLIASVATWGWARGELGSAGGAMATLLFTTRPIVLGYSGIANHDAAALAGVALSLWAFAHWLDRPTPSRAVVFGAAYGLAIGLKFSCLPYVPLACVAMYIVRLAFDSKTRKAAWRNAIPALALAAPTAFLVLWATYGFVFGSLENFGLQLPPLQGGVARVFTAIDPSLPIPLPHFIDGMATLIGFEGEFLSYFDGHLSTTGFRWYFPAAVAVKTSLASLLLLLLGVVFSRSRLFFSALAAALAILAVAIPSSLDLGIRYVLPLYAPLTVAMAAAALALLESGPRWMRVAVFMLLTWHMGASALAHPDYFPYFNELAGPEPSQLLIDSNLDWGQDVLRLREEVRRLKVPFLNVSLMGPADLNQLRFPPNSSVDPWTSTQGWVAVSEHSYRMFRAQGGYLWLAGRPYQRVGKSIRLYDLR